MIRLLFGTALMNFALYLIGFSGFDFFTSYDSLFSPLLGIPLILGLLLCIWGVLYCGAEGDAITAVLFVVAVTLWVQLFSWPWNVADLIHDFFPDKDYLFTVLATYIIWPIASIVCSVIFIKRFLSSD